MMRDHFIRSWEGVTPFFYWFSNLFENKARNRSLALAELAPNGSICIIAPPTEYFVDTLLAENISGSSHCVYFSEKMKKRGDDRLRSTKAQTALARKFDHLPYGEGCFDAVFAYCFLDFMEDHEIEATSKELHRILKPGGRFLGTYLAPHKTLTERVSSFFFTSLGFLSKGVRVVEVAPALEEAGFVEVRIMHCPQCGFPIGLAYAKK